jgi:hypothetical protein
MRFLFIGILLLASATKAQVLKDAALWTDVYIEKRLSKQITIHADQQNRFDNNISQYGYGSLELGGSYRFSKYFRVTTGYALSEKKTEELIWKRRHKIFLAGIGRMKLGAFTFAIRDLIQNKIEDADDEERSVYNRTKLSAKYEINKRLTPYVSHELYFPLRSTASGFDRSRTVTGISYRISKVYEVDLYFLLQDQFSGKKQREYDYVYGLSFNISLD